MKQNNSTRLNCFTPPVALATFIIEILFALYILVRHQRDRFMYGMAATLLLLGTFQLSEYMLCMGCDQWWWLRIVHVAITLLPALGLHMVRMQTKSRGRIAVIAAYAAAAAFSIAYFTLPDMLAAVTCTGTFVAFHVDSTFNMLYGIFYLGLLTWAIVELLNAMKNRVGDQIIIGWMLAGYSSFIVPMAIIYMLIEGARIGIPSIMCGFAVLLALIIVCAIMPRHRELQLSRINKKTKKRR